MTQLPCQAILLAGSTETVYHRAGAGSPVILLYYSGLPDPFVVRLFERLALRFRVIAPVRPAEVGNGGQVAISQWLRDLVDGLGLLRVSLVADEGFAAATLGFALAESERVADVVAIVRDRADPARPVVAIADRLTHAAHRLLVVSVDTGGDPSVAASAVAHAIVPFLDGAE